MQRRVLPALRGLPEVERIDLASTQVRHGGLSGWDAGTVFDGYGAGLAKSAASLVYVSLVNAAHQEWAEAALSSGRHVIVDKPAFLGLSQTDAVLAQADRTSQCVAEATVFAYHPQVQAIRDSFAAAGDQPKRATVTFSFPPLDAANFRYRRALGGGALWDLGPYAASVGRVFFGAQPARVGCTVLSHHNEVESAFVVELEYPDGRSVVGTFGFDTVYRNRLDLIGAELGVELDRAFTIPADLPNELRLTRRSGAETVQVPPGDAFAAFFRHVIQCIEAHDWRGLAEDMERDAHTLHRLRVAAGLELRL